MESFSDTLKIILFDAPVSKIIFKGVPLKSTSKMIKL
jgi:hypothetical protein